MPKSKYQKLKSEYQEWLESRKDTASRPRPHVDKSYIDTLGIWSKFQEAFDVLCKKWWDPFGSPEVDTEGKRLMDHALMTCSTNPIIASIIADDLDCFKKHYLDKDNALYYFELCCFCGAENIINNFFLTSNVTSFLKRSENAIAYACASGKRELALKLAKKAAEFGREEPGPVILYDVYREVSLSEINAIFTQNSRKNSTKQSNDMPCFSVHKRHGSPTRNTKKTYEDELNNEAKDNAKKKQKLIKPESPSLTNTSKK